MAHDSKVFRSPQNNSIYKEYDETQIKWITRPVIYYSPSSSSSPSTSAKEEHEEKPEIKEQEEILEEQEVEARGSTSPKKNINRKKSQAFIADGNPENKLLNRSRSFSVSSKSNYEVGEEIKEIVNNFASISEEELEKLRR